MRWGRRAHVSGTWTQAQTTTGQKKKMRKKRNKIEMFPVNPLPGIPNTFGASKQRQWKIRKHLSLIKQAEQTKNGHLNYRIEKKKNSHKNGKKLWIHKEWFMVERAARAREPEIHSSSPREPLLTCSAASRNRNGCYIFNEIQNDNEFVQPPLDYHSTSCPSPPPLHHRPIYLFWGILAHQRLISLISL